jgi:hypothetical protein
MAALVRPPEDVREEPMDREEVRARWHASVPRWYSPWAHLAFPSVVGIGLIAVAIASVRDLRPWQLFMVPLVFVLSNITEWRAHKHILHRRFWPLHALYERHTPNHHRVFITTDMTIRSAREFRFVLLPFYAIVAIFAITCPITLVLLLFGLRNLAALYVATSMAYVVCYEWLHLINHLPETTRIARIPFIRSLCRHHATHHDPAIMQKWNFNVMPPLWDWVRGTTFKGPRAPR